MNWKQVEAYLEHDDRAVLPLGSTEQHSGLSLATDFILSERVAVEAAEPLGVPVFPGLPYGITPYFMAYPGTVDLSLETYSTLLTDILGSLAAHGFKRIVVVNGHGGNAPVKEAIDHWLETEPGVAVRFHNWWNAPETLAKVKATDPIASHASWMENFPWTRLPGVDYSGPSKTPIDIEYLHSLEPTAARELLGDGNFAGLYQRPDEEMLVIWQTAVEETRRVIAEGWD